MSTDEPTTHVAVVVCTRDRPDKIGQALTSILANDHPAFRVTVVDQSTTDDTRRLVESIAATDDRVEYVHSSAPGLSRAYNTGVARSAGEVIAFTDDDCIVPTDWLRSIVSAFAREPDGDLLYGQVLPAHPDGDGTELTPFLLIPEAARLSRSDGFRVFGMGANFAVRRRLFDAIGGFDEVLGGGGPLRSSQDYDLAYRAYRAGRVILLRPEVTLRHDGRREADDWPALLLNYGIGDGAFYTKHVRCRDPYALLLLLRRLGRTGASHLVKRARRQDGADGSYVRGMLVGIRDSFRFGVDRDRRLYTTG